MAGILEMVFGCLTIAMVFVVGAAWGFAVVPCVVAVICAMFYADAKRGEV